MITFVQVEGSFFESGLSNQPERKGPGKVDLASVKKRGRVSSTGKNAFSVAINAKGNAGCKAPLQSAVEPAIEAGENFRGAGIEFCQHASCADDKRDRHSGFQALAARRRRE